MRELPVIDVAPLIAGAAELAAAGSVAGEIQAACREHGFFYVAGHGVLAELLNQLVLAYLDALTSLGQAALSEDGGYRWDGQDPRAFDGSYGDYLLGKVSKVFPQLRSEVR